MKVALEELTGGGGPCSIEFDADDIHDYGEGHDWGRA